MSHDDKSTQELTLRKSADLKLANSEEVFRLLVEAVEDYAIFFLDPNGIISTWNLGARRLKGYTADEVIGTHFSRFYAASDKERNHPAFELAQAIEKGKYEEEGWRIRKDGTRFWANVVITVMRDESGRHIGFSKVTRDLTERKLAEEKLRDAYHDLERRIEMRTRELSQAKARAENAVRAREEFFSIASHELKTPLASLKLQAQIRRRAVEKGDLSDFTPQNLPELCRDDERQIQRLVFLVENMLDISKLTSGTFVLNLQSFDMTELVNEVAKSLTPLLKVTGNTCTVKASEPCIGAWDRQRLEQVFTNLLSNAGKYAPGRPIELTVACLTDGVKIEIRDFGNGISAEDQQFIFKPFRRGTSSTGSGLGLGLYICKQIVESHQGSIELTSSPENGTAFTIKLPRSVEENAAE